ncbi:MAG: hypothetical protein RMH74_06935 [Candidatus Caldarchaeum sp.]|nr:hypothetical protein [Candidatus Caldarchaeum sp.]
MTLKRFDAFGLGPWVLRFTKITVIDNAGNSASDTCDATFTIIS